MAAIKSEMPPLHAAESTASALSAMGSGGVSSGSGGGVGANGPTGNATNATANSTTSSASGTNAATVVNNTISAAADSSDNQPGTPQPQTQQIGVNDQQQTATSTGGTHHPYASHNMYATTSTTAAGTLPHMYSGSIYATSSGAGGQDMQQQQQHQQQSSYPSYLSSYEQFYQQQGQAQTAHSNSSAGNGSSGLDFSSAASLYGANNSNDFKSSASSAGIRYHPYLQTPTSNGVGNLSNDGSEVGAATVTNQVGLPLSSNNGAVSTTTAMSPRVVSSSSPTSTSTQLHMGGGGGGGNPQSPACGQLLCKKCGIMCTNESELQEHITNVHGASPYGSSGYSSSPYIKEELSGAPPSQPPQQQQTGVNPNELLDLDSQKMVYPPIPGSVQSIMGHSGLHHQQQQHHAMHDPLVNDPLHSMHSMQQRALPGWDQTASMGGAPGNGNQEGLPAYMQQADITQKSNQSPYYSPKQSPYHGNSVPGVTNIKHEYPLIKSEYADSQNYVDKSFDPTVAAAAEMCQQQAQNANATLMPVSSSPAEFPSTTTGPAQEQQQSYRNFEPPTSSSVLPANSITAKAATWKSNEARRPKTYNCTACNKWFTSSGHLKRHYNTTLHKNAVKTSGQPDPATMPISAHHHPARDPNDKSSRRGNNAAAAAAAAQQQKPPAPVQPPEPPRTPPDFGSTTQQQQTNGGMPFGQPNGYQQQPQPYLAQVQSTTNVSPQHGASAVGATQSQIQSETVLNGHPNGLAGPSALITTTAAQTTLLMPSSHTRGLLNTTTTITKREHSAEEDINTTATTTTAAAAAMLHSPMDMSMMGGKETAAMLPATVLDAAAETAAAAQSQLQTHHHQLLVKQELPELDQHQQQQEYQLLDLQQQQQQLQRHYHNTTPNSQAQSPLIISHQQYQEQLHLQQQQMVADIFSQQPQLQAHMQQPHNTMEAYSILGISTPPPHSSSMQLLPPSQRITSTIATTANMDSIHMLPPQHSLLRHLPLEEPEAHNMHSNTIITSMPDTQRNTIITPHIPLPSIIPSYQQVPQPEAQLPLEHTMTYHTIIGNAANYGGNNLTSLSSSNSSSATDESGVNNGDHFQLSSYDPYGTTSMFTTTDGQLLQFISNNGLMQPTYFSTFPTRTAAVAESYVRSYSASSTQQRSPQEADLPPINSLTHNYNQTPQESQTTLMAPLDMPYSPTVSSSTTADGNGLLDDYNTAVAAMEKSLKNSDTPKTAAKPNVRRAKRDASSISSATTNNPNPAKRKRSSTAENVTTTGNVSTTTANVMLPSGRIKCVECDKEFTKICYLTQHNKCFHSGEYPYRCEKCGKRFQDEEVYTTHLGRHKTADKPHKCELCPKQFHHKTDLRRHIEGIHTGMKQHVCDICQKSFCRKDHLRKHLETHNRPRVVSRKAASKAAPKTTQTVKASLAVAKQVEENYIVKNEAFAAASPAMSQHQHDNDGGESSPLDGDCAALDLYVVIKNENQKQLNMQQLSGSTIKTHANDDDDIDVADDDMDLDHDEDEIDEGEYLLGGCEENKEIFHHKILMQRSLPHFQQNKLLQHL